MSVGIGNSVLEITSLHSFISGNTFGNQTFILDSHRPIICSVLSFLYTVDLHMLEVDYNFLFFVPDVL
jgi:hypothetical protein